VRSYDPAAPALDEGMAGADVVLVHEWNDPALANAIPAAARRAGALVLFHDTHHRPWSQPEAIARFDLAAFDGVLAFGDVLREVYRDRFGVERAWTLHEAADTVRFRPLDVPKTQDVVWIGNWGDEERTQELRDFWLAPASRNRDLRWTAHGVRYPEYALAELREAGVEFRGWAPSLRVPEAFSSARATLHVPRRAYVEALAGIPTIRVFEALACGIPSSARRGATPRGSSAPATTPSRRRPPRWRPPSCAWCAARTRRAARRSAGWRRSSPATPATTARTSCCTSWKRSARREAPEPAQPPNRMHLTFFGSSLVSSYWNGAATYYRGLLRALHERGHRITFCEPDAYGRQQKRDLARTRRTPASSSTARRRSATS
jgi:spore maturation protein CgeB